MQSGNRAHATQHELLAQAVYDSESGQLLTGFYLDDAMTRTTDLPRFVIRAIPERAVEQVARAAA